MKSAILIFFALNSAISFAQKGDLYIYHNVHKDSTWFMKNNKAIDDPTIKKGEQIYFQLIDFNNYIYRAEIRATQSATNMFVSSNNTAVKGLLSGLITGFLPGLSLPLLSTPIFGNLLNTIPQVDAANARGDIEELTSLKILLEELEPAKNEINDISNQISKSLKSIASLQNSTEFINSLIKNPTLPPSQSKAILLNHCQEVFLKAVGEEIVFDDIALLNEKLINVPIQKKELDEKLSQFTNKLTKLGSLRVRLASIDHGIPELYPEFKNLEAIEPSLHTTSKEITSKLENRYSKIEFASDYTTQIQNYFIKYNEIKENTFTYVHHVKAEEKFIIYDFDLYRDDSIANGEIKSTLVKNVEVRVKSYGGASFGVNVGLTGSKFLKTPQDYFVRNQNEFSTIYATDGDPYVPMISSLFSLSYDYKSTFTPTINLGIGIPFAKNESVENFAIFAGPGLYVGKKKAVMLSGGTMFSKVKVLSNGFQVGDQIVIGEGQIPTTKKYSFGYFLGLTYNLFAQ
ncbi:MAG: hypothetical protein IPP01_11100 [Saprospiraceae bacterium]|nr:hypothetical protein [Saprospiraceae bacterium]